MFLFISMNTNRKFLGFGSHSDSTFNASTGEPSYIELLALISSRDDEIAQLKRKLEQVLLILCL